MRSPTAHSAAFLTFTLHAHLPFVVNHGTWPHGIEWLHEAAAETYLPLLRTLENLAADGLALHCNLSISPILLEQLAHPVFQAEFVKYVERKMVAAREDEAYFTSMNEPHYAHLARFWHSFFATALAQFEALDRDIIKGFRRFAEQGLIEIITCGATHGYMPLLGTDESVRAQVRLAVATHRRHLGTQPKGMWVPECGYRPAGFWSYPVPNGDGSTSAPAFDRIGVEQALSESGVQYFFVDTHLVEESAAAASPYSLRQQPAAKKSAAAALQNDPRSLYKPYFVEGPSVDTPAVAIFPRDPTTGAQVWSGDTGYPGDAQYLDFHKKRWPGGHRYWSVTGAHVDMANKQPYYPEAALERVRAHAEHYVELVRSALEQCRDCSTPPILCSPFDAELFGHWWFEGALWLEAVVRALQGRGGNLQLTSCSRYLEQYPAAGSIAMHEGSWGAEGTNHVWMNPDTSWTYTHIYPAELYTREVCTAMRWNDRGLGERIVKQLCRELLLLESSDWQFLITTGAARDYAELRFATHLDQFKEIRATWEAFSATGELSAEQHERLAAIELRDSIFADIDPAFWVAGAHDSADRSRR